MSRKKTAIIIGAGPAGLAAARQLVNTQHFQVHVLEKADKVGGISRTESHNGYLFDIGGHRFFSRDPVITGLWQEMLGRDFLTVRRRSRIFYRRRYFSYPLNLWETVGNLGSMESLISCLSYLKAKIFPFADEDTFEQWTVNRFGRRLYEMFFKSYTEKVWGIPCTRIRSDWAAQRIKGLSFRTALSHALFRNTDTVSLIEAFSYPRLGPGMMWEKFSHEIQAAGGSVELGSPVVAIHHTDGLVREVSYRQADDIVRRPADEVVASLPLDNLISIMDPSPPPEILEAASKISYRSFIIIILVFDEEDLFPDQWLYIHSPEVTVGRIQNFKNWSPAMVPDQRTTSLGLEYFCDENDTLWSSDDQDLIRLAIQEIGHLGIARAGKVIDSCVLRQPKAYPVYDEHYREHVEVLKTYLGQIRNLQTIGRNGMHRYSNMDLAMTSGILAAQNITGARHDLWQLGNSADYLEAGSPREHEGKLRSAANPSTSRSECGFRCP
jgi:protoporphyrinogen oxidase